jgi:hypothetical protein
MVPSNEPTPRKHNPIKELFSDFNVSAFPPAATGYRRMRPKTYLRTQPSPTIEEQLPLKKYHLIKTVREAMPKTEAYIRNYGDAHRRKVI